MTNASAPRLELRQGQSQNLVMTQQLQQSIKLLQMTAQELNLYVDQQLESNPFLSAEEGMETDQRDPEALEPEAPAEDTDESFLPEDWRSDESDFRDGSEMRMQVVARDRDGDAFETDDSQARDISLREHLLEQLSVSINDPVLRGIGMHLVDLVDEAGYIKEDLNAVADQLGTGMTEIAQALVIMQRFDPAGVCARNLAECLTLQLKERDRFDPAMGALVENLDMLAQGQLAQLARKCGVDSEDLREMIAELRGLNPKPGLAFSHDIVQVVEPDVTVRTDNKGNWHVELNMSALPKVLVNRRYYSKIAANSKGTDRKYVTEKLHEANWLIKALDQRANTILKVATELVGQQENFFRMGIHHLKPLTLKDIARETGFHESTISRVTTGKYMITPRGTYEFKYFFTSGVSHGAGGDDVSSQTVKHVIKELIENEGKKVLSDDDLADVLKARNINVARRTVAKYREAMHIPSSMLRRRMKQVGG